MFFFPQYLKEGGTNKIKAIMGTEKLTDKKGFIFSSKTEKKITFKIHFDKAFRMFSLWNKNELSIQKFSNIFENGKCPYIYIC